jgi:hypothetical protein
VLLNLYRFNSTTRRDLRAVLQGLGGNLWIPHRIFAGVLAQPAVHPRPPQRRPKQSIELPEKARKTAENAVSAWREKIALDDVRRSELLNKPETAFQAGYARG